MARFQDLNYRKYKDLKYPLPLPNGLHISEVRIFGLVSNATGDLKKYIINIVIANRFHNCSVFNKDSSFIIANPVHQVVTLLGNNRVAQCVQPENIVPPPHLHQSIVKVDISRSVKR